MEVPLSDLMWVDDNTSMTDGMVVLFELAGHKVSRAQDASAALELIHTHGIDKFGAVIVDVMVTGGSNGSFFSREKTRDYVLTGLVLAEAIVDKYGEAGRKRIFIYTRATQEWVLRAVDTTARALNVQWSRRGAQITPEHFLSMIEGMIGR